MRIGEKVTFKDPTGADVTGRVESIYNGYAAVRLAWGGAYEVRI